MDALLIGSLSTSASPFTSTLDSSCSSADWGNVTSLGCDGKCDKRISEILKIDSTMDSWMGTSPVGIYYEFATFNIELYRFLGKSIQEMKAQEHTIWKTGAAYPTNSTHAFRTQWGAGTRLYEFFNVYWYNLQQLNPKIDPNHARLSFSSTASWKDTSLSSFMSVETVPYGTAYWLAGSIRGQGSGFDTQFYHPTGLALDRAGRVYVSDSGNARILRIENIWDANSYSTSPVGTGYATFNGDGDRAEETSLMFPKGLTMDAGGDLLFADTKSHDIRKVVGMTWNDPCPLSDSYKKQVTEQEFAEQSEYLKDIRGMVDCRLQQVRAVVLDQVVSCMRCSKLENPQADTSDCPRSMYDSLCSAQSAWGAKKVAYDSHVTTNNDRNYFAQTDADPMSMFYEGRSFVDDAGLSQLLKEITGDCSQCPKAFGCDLESSIDDVFTRVVVDATKEQSSQMIHDTRPPGSPWWSPEYGTSAANMVWNETTGPEPFELTGLLSENAVIKYKEAIAELNTLRSQTFYDDTVFTSIKEKMAAFIGATTATEKSLKAVDLKNALCPTSASSLSSTTKIMQQLARIHFYHWFTYISNVCVEVIGSPEVDRAANVGAQYYDRTKMSNMVSEIFRSTYDTQNKVWTSSQCAPKCDVMHPRFFNNGTWRSLEYKPRRVDDVGPEIMRWPAVTENCCGTHRNGPLCEEGEGPCELNSDCKDSLVCGTNNCLWSKSHNCCAQPDLSNAYAKMSDVGRATTYATLFQSFT
jgi:hypothetical protein